MEYVKRLLSDIFLMKFDIIIPISGCLVALALALIMFLIRYISFTKKRRKFEKKMEQEKQEENTLEASATGDDSSVAVESVSNMNVKSSEKLDENISQFFHHINNK